MAHPPFSVGLWNFSQEIYKTFYHHIRNLQMSLADLEIYQGRRHMTCETCVGMLQPSFFLTGFNRAGGMAPLAPSPRSASERCVKISTFFIISCQIYSHAAPYAIKSLFVSCTDKVGIIQESDFSSCILTKRLPYLHCRTLVKIIYK